MTEKRTFAEILEEKLGDLRPKVPRKCQNLSEKIDYSVPFISQNFANCSFVFAPKSNPYPQVRRPRPLTKPIVEEAPSAQEEVRRWTLWQLEERSQLAFRQLEELGARLPREALTLDLAKSEFRRLAKKYHPDRGQQASADKFIQLKKSHAQLEKGLLELIKKDELL